MVPLISSFPKQQADDYSGRLNGVNPADQRDYAKLNVPRPPGAALSRAPRGWRMIDQQSRKKNKKSLARFFPDALQQAHARGRHGRSVSWPPRHGRLAYDEFAGLSTDAAPSAAGPKTGVKAVARNRSWQRHASAARAKGVASMPRPVRRTRALAEITTTSG